MKDNILVISTWVNHPETLPYHCRLWKNAFKGEEVDYVAYIDAKNDPHVSNFGEGQMLTKLISTCEECDIIYEIVDPFFHKCRSRIFPKACYREVDETPSARDALACQVAWIDHVVKDCKYKRIVLVQSDIFPYRQRVWSDLMGSSEIYYKPQVREGALYYAWEGLCCFDVGSWPLAKREMVSFEYGFMNGVFGDTGAGTWEILAALPEEAKRPWSGLDSLQWNNRVALPELPYWVVEHLKMDPRNKTDPDGVIWYYSEIQDGWCFHLRAGGNWDGAGKDIHEKRYGNFMRLLKEAIEDGSEFLI